MDLSLASPPHLSFPLETLARLTAHSLKTTTVPSSTVLSSPALTVTQPTLSGAPTIVTYTGYTAIGTYLASTSTKLHLSPSPDTFSTLDSWVSASFNLLAPLLVAKTFAPFHTSAATQFVASLDNHLKTATYLTAGPGSYADILVASLLSVCQDKGYTIPAEHVNVARWFTTVGHVAGLKLKAVVVEKKGEKAAEKKGEKEEKPATAEASKPLTPMADDDAYRTSNDLVASLAAMGITYTIYTHTAAFTSLELEEFAPGLAHTKNVFLKDKKHGYFLITGRHDSDTNTKIMIKGLGLTGANPRMASEDDLGKYLGVKKGSVGPMCIKCDGEQKVTFVFDKRMMEVDTIYSHPGDNTVSVGMSPKDLVKFVETTGHEVKFVDFPVKGEAPPASAKPAGGEKKQGKQGKQEKVVAKKQNAEGTLLALQYKKMSQFHEWYSDVITLSEMISYYDISGCYILRPWAYSIWDSIQTWFNVQLKELEVDNTYFPLFVSKSRLEKEKEHVEGFAAEVAWVTKSGDGDLAEHIAIRPTSETIMYPAFSDWIKSHRDLPLKINQWSNVVRWEFKNPTPFLRSREFLWQEGHTAHESYEESQEMVMQGLELYRGVYEDLLAIPVVQGYKTEKERFAGGFMTTTCEAYIPASGRAIQGATSHNLGQNFGKMFDINFQDKEGKTAIPWQTSWGITTRTIGVMVMVHGDDTGLVLPPRVAPLQVVIVDIISKKMGRDVLEPYCRDIAAKLKAKGVRVKYDDRVNYTGGWKYNHWEQKGVPIRIEVGPRDVEAKSCRLCVRYNGEKYDFPVDGLDGEIETKLVAIQKAMFDKVKKERDEHMVKVMEWKDFVPNLEKGNLILTPWCDPKNEEWEEKVKKMSREEALAGAEEDEKCAISVAGKTLCIPFDQPELPKGTKCFASGLEATCWVMWGRSY